MLLQCQCDGVARLCCLVERLALSLGTVTCGRTHEPQAYIDFNGQQSALHETLYSGTTANIAQIYLDPRQVTNCLNL